MPSVRIIGGTTIRSVPVNATDIRSAANELRRLSDMFSDLGREKLQRAVSRAGETQQQFIEEAVMKQVRRILSRDRPESG